MARDYSKFLPLTMKADPGQRQLSRLDTLGWQPFFAQQTSLDELTQTPPVRITEVHRNAFHVVGEDIDKTIPSQGDATVGDWLMYDPVAPQSSRVLDRKSLVKRRAPGTDRQIQLIAANIDTGFVVSSCNQDFNIARLERYVALLFEADITPVIILTKADLVPAPQDYVDEACKISELVSVLTLDARGHQPKEMLAQWCKPGQTMAFLGSSGVGKSTLINALVGTQAIETQAIREDDAKGRHTTTSRQLHIVPDGYVVMDTPGMRELQMSDAASGIENLFADLHDLSTQCKFSDCQHMTEPGCAVLEAIENGEIDSARMARWRKLLAEEAFNSATMLERRNKDKAFGKMVRQVIKQKPRWR